MYDEYIEEKSMPHIFFDEIQPQINVFKEKNHTLIKRSFDLFKFFYIFIIIYSLYLINV